MASHVAAEPRTRPLTVFILTSKLLTSYRSRSRVHRPCSTSQRISSRLTPCPRIALQSERSRGEFGVLSDHSRDAAKRSCGEVRARPAGAKSTTSARPNCRPPPRRRRRRDQNSAKAAKRTDLAGASRTRRVAAMDRLTPLGPPDVSPGLVICTIELARRSAQPSASLRRVSSPSGHAADPAAHVKEKPPAVACRGLRSRSDDQDQKLR